MAGSPCRRDICAYALSMGLFDAMALASVIDRTGAAVGDYRPADGLTVRHENTIYGVPPVFRYKLHQALFCLQGRFSADESESVRDAVNMRVYTDGWLCECYGEYKVGGLSPDARECHKPISRGRDLSPPGDGVGKAFEMFGFCSIKTYRKDEVGDLFFRKCRKAFRILDTREEALERVLCRGIGGARAHDRADENLEWVRSLGFRKIDDRCLFPSHMVVKVF